MDADSAIQKKHEKSEKSKKSHFSQCTFKKPEWDSGLKNEGADGKTDEATELSLLKGNDYFGNNEQYYVDWQLAKHKDGRNLRSIATLIYKIIAEFVLW